MNIAFIGGIHGVGKSTLCKTICEKTGIKYLLASDVLKWKELSSNSTNKNVDRISYTQERLIRGLESIVNEDNRYLLDGHYCLLNKHNAVEKIPVETFIQINPYSLNIITSDISSIRERLEKRDNKLYDEHLLRDMQEIELSYAKELAAILKVKLNVCAADDLSNIINALK